MAEASIWERYWHFDRIASCFDGAGASNYDESIGAGWRDFFCALPMGARIIDLCTGNGAAALIAAETGRRENKAFEIVAVDQAKIDPPSYVTRHAEDFAAIHFEGSTSVEALPFSDARFDAAISQYGIEYSDLARSIPELARIVAPGGVARLVVHAADGVVAAGSRAVIAEADLLLDRIDLPGSARRCFEAVSAVERTPGASADARRRADESFADFQTALMRTARNIERASDKMMFRNSGAVLLDTFKRRRHFDVSQLLAKADEIHAEIHAHRGRLTALVEAALDKAEANALAEAVCRAGAKEARATALDNRDGLIAHVVEAQF